MILLCTISYWHNAAAAAVSLYPSLEWTLTAAKQFVTQWYLEGIVMTPIVCVSNRKCYRFLR